MRSKASGWVLTIARTLDSLGIDHRELFQQAGLDPEALRSRNSRYSELAVRRLWQLAVEETRGMNFGLRVTEHIRPSTFDVVGYAMICSSTLREAVHRFARFEKLISNSATVTVTETSHSLKVGFEFDIGGGAQPAWQAIDTSIAGLVRFLSWIACRDLIPVSAHFRHQGTSDLTEYRKVLPCPIFFSAPENCVVFHNTDMDQPILSADEQLASVLDVVAINNMVEVSEPFIQKVRKYLKLQFQDGHISRLRTARLMNLSERSLLRRLKDEGTTFQEVLDKFREELAYKYMLRPGITIQEVSGLLGFSEPSTFSRAFKRWTGHNPSSSLGCRPSPGISTPDPHLQVRH